MSSLICPRCRVEYPDRMDRCPVDGADLCEREALQRVGTMVNNYLVGEVIGSSSGGPGKSGSRTMVAVVCSRLFLPEGHWLVRSTRFSPGCSSRVSGCSCGSL